MQVMDKRERGFQDSSRCMTSLSEMGLSADEMELLSQNSKEVVFSQGETVIKQSTFAEHVFYLEKGLVKIILESEYRKRFACGLLSSGSFFGLSFLHSEHFHFGAETLKESTICQIRKDAFRQVIEDNGRANRFMLEWYGQQYQYLFRKLEVNSTRNSHGKLATTLYGLCDEVYRREKVFEFLNRGDLAELSGISRESTNKILREFENDRLIDISTTGIEVKKPGLLKRLSMIG